MHHITFIGLFMLKRCNLNEWKCYMQFKNTNLKLGLNILNLKLEAKVTICTIRGKYLSQSGSLRECPP